MLCLIVLAGVLLSAESCVIPLQFEAKESMLTGVLPVGSSTPIVSQIYLNISYDANIKMTSARGNSTVVGQGTGSEFIQIDDYPNHLRYTVSITTAGSHCTKQPLTEDFPDSKSIMAHATKLESGYYGIGNKKTRFDNYLLNEGQLTVNFAMDEQCMTIDETFYGQEGSNMLIGSARIYNATVGIKDPSVFKIPDICKQAVLVPATGRESTIGRRRRSIF